MIACLSPSILPQTHSNFVLAPTASPPQCYDEHMNLLLQDCEETKTTTEVDPTTLETVTRVRCAGMCCVADCTRFLRPLPPRPPLASHPRLYIRPPSRRRANA